jgi:uroporphyrinogen-III synthase
MEKTLKLEGLNVICFEARHAKTLADLVAKQGGKPFSAPAMKEVPLEKNPEAFRFAEELFAGRIDVLLLLTGVGTRALATVLETKYPREKFLEAIRRVKIVPRGPKPVRVLNEWGIPFALTVPEPNTWKEILNTFDAHSKDVPLAGKRVAVQEYGVANPELLTGLRGRGADVFRVPVYRWALPDDLSPLKEAIRRILEGLVQVTVFTTAIQITHLLEVAETMGKKKETVAALNRTVVASVGPDCSEALRVNGVKPDIEPESPKMGPLIVAVAEKTKEILKAKR